MGPGDLTRRGLLASILGVLVAACGAVPVTPPEPPLTPLSTDPLDRLVAGAGLLWLVRARPREIAQIPWLIPAIGQIVPEPRFDAFKKQTGLDPRQVPEVLVVEYDASLGGALAVVARHHEDPLDLERRMRARLTSAVQIASERPDVGRVSGHIGQSPRAFARIGRDAVVFQYAGDLARGPARIATLYAVGKLEKVTPALAAEPLVSMMSRFGKAPFVAIAPGPFGGEPLRAARGLLAGAAAVGLAARPTARENLGIALAIAGDFGEHGAAAAEVLGSAWRDVATSELGRMLGLDTPVEPPLTAGDRGILTLGVEIRPDRFAEGLRALLRQDVEEIMRL